MQKSVNGKKFLSGNYFSQEENIVFPVGGSVFLMRVFFPFCMIFPGRIVPLWKITLKRR